VWIIAEMNLSVWDVAILKRARKEGWAKMASMKAVVELAHAKADSKVGRPTTEQSVALRAEIIETHRDEWSDHRRLFTLEAMQGEDGLAVARMAKTAAESIKVRQEGERKAWGLDVIAEDSSSGVATLDELDAMFAQAMKRSDEMRDALRRERKGIVFAGQARD
jgi:hypothetical protein